MKNSRSEDAARSALASTRMLAGTPQRAASSDPKSDSFSTHPQSGEGRAEKLVQDKAGNHLPTLI
jgi:hypothetical protein